MPPFKIQNPCSKKWDSMKIEVDSRFCKHCEKNVIDFTQKTRTEILEYLLTNNNKKSRDLTGNLTRNYHRIARNVVCDVGRVCADARR